MTPAAPQFPSLNAWEGMSELEQDALIDRIEKGRRRRLLWSRIQAAVMWLRPPCASADWSIWL